MKPLLEEQLRNNERTHDAIKLARKVTSAAVGKVVFGLIIFLGILITYAIAFNIFGDPPNQEAMPNQEIATPTPVEENEYTPSYMAECSNRLVQTISTFADQNKNICEELDGDYLFMVVNHICYWSKINDVDPLLVSAIITIETGWVSQEKCGPYGCGLMQITGGTAKSYGYRREEMLDIEKNIKVGTAVLKQVNNNLTAYNGGATIGYKERVLASYTKMKSIKQTNE